MICIEIWDSGARRAAVVRVRRFDGPMVLRGSRFAFRDSGARTCRAAVVRVRRFDGPMVLRSTTCPYHVSIHTGPDAGRGTRRTGRDARTHAHVLTRAHARTQTRLVHVARDVRVSIVCRGCQPEDPAQNSCFSHETDGFLVSDFRIFRELEFCRIHGKHEFILNFMNS